MTVSFLPAFAQHHSGSVSPPIDFGGLKMALSTILSPENFSFEDTKSANLAIRFFESDTDTNIQKVTYRVQIFYEDSLVANEYFYDEDGNLDLEIRPTKNCEEENSWKCTKYFGEKHPIAGGYYARGDSRPILEGPIFDKSGQYNVKVAIVGATNPKTMTTTDLNFETFLIIPLKQSFLIQTADAQEFPVSIKSFDAKVIDFTFDETTNKISFNVPFDWNHGEHFTPNLKQTIHLQKEFSIFREGHEVDIFIEGTKLQGGSVEFYTESQKENVLSLDIPHEELMSIQNKLGKNQSSDTGMKIEILPGKQIVLNQLDFNFENEYFAKVTWDSKLTAGQKIPFTFRFFDSNGAPAMNILFAYSLIDSNGKEFWTNIGTGKSYIGILSTNGVTQESVLFPTEGKYQIKLILTGQGTKNFEKFLSSQAEFNISSQMIHETKKDMSIPSWIKNNAGWWAEGIIEDREFTQAIQYLIKENVLVIPPTEAKVKNSQEIPSWIKNNAGWWAKDQIDDESFIQGIQFLVKEGIIKL